MINRLLFPLDKVSNDFIKDINDLAANRAFLYGDGFFESMRWHDGKINFYEDHYSRIERSFDILKFSKKYLHKDELHHQIASAASFAEKDARVRLTFFRVAEGFYAPEEGNVAVMINVQSLDTEQYMINARPIATGIYKEHFKSRHTLSNLKSINSLVFVMAGIYAKENKLDEIIILNDAGHICEANASNFFLVKDAVIYTPPLSEGCVDGVMRKQTISFAEKKGLQLIQKPLSIEELLNADEVFFSSGVRGLITVGSCMNSFYKNEVTAILFRELLKA
jgi:branched-chain amino acid aminotransferase